MSCGNEMTTGKVVDTRTMKQKLNEAIFDEEKQNIANSDLFMVADIAGLTIFCHEAVWTKFNRKPIPTGKLVFHKDGDPMNNDSSNLDITDENTDAGDLHEEKNKIFHEHNYIKNKEFIRVNFDDIYEVLFGELNRDY